MNPPRTVNFWRGKLPHWEVENGAYFITLRLAGAIPRAGIARIRAISESLDGASLPASLAVQRRIFREMERWLDRAPSVQHLAEPTVAPMLVESIAHRERHGEWSVREFVLLPNHLHLLMVVGEGALKSSLESFKRWTGHQAAELLGIRGQSFWQREWFDHWIRNPAELDRVAEYIRQNPVKAGLAKDFRDWPWGSWNLRPE